jgi:hypothetical protein
VSVHRRQIRRELRWATSRKPSGAGGVEHKRHACELRRLITFVRYSDMMSGMRTKATTARRRSARRREARPRRRIVDGIASTRDAVRNADTQSGVRTWCGRGKLQQSDGKWNSQLARASRQCSRIGISSARLPLGPGSSCDTLSACVTWLLRSLPVQQEKLLQDDLDDNYPDSYRYRRDGATHGRCSGLERFSVIDNPAQAVDRHRRARSADPGDLFELRGTRQVSDVDRDRRRIVRIFEVDIGRAPDAREQRELRSTTWSVSVA